MSLIAGCPLEEHPVCALLDAWHWFKMVDGENCPQAIEAIERLLSAEMRLALRSWYRRYGEDMNPAAIEFRHRIGEMAGEKFG